MIILIAENASSSTLNHTLIFASVKTRNFIAALLAVYMVALVFVPCADACDTHAHEIPFTAGTAQDHHEEDNNLCSPFCICSCCNSPVTFLMAPAFLSVTFITSELLQIPATGFISNDYSSIWQPPKIS